MGVFLAPARASSRGPGRGGASVSSRGPQSGAFLPPRRGEGRRTNRSAWEGAGPRSGAPRGSLELRERGPRSACDGYREPALEKRQPREIPWKAVERQAKSAVTSSTRRACRWAGPSRTHRAAGKTAGRLARRPVDRRVPGERAFFNGRACGGRAGVNTPCRRAGRAARNVPPGLNGRRPRRETGWEPQPQLPTQTT